MVRVVGKEGALGAGVGGWMKATSWMARKIMTWYQLLRSVVTLADFDCKWGVWTNWAGNKRGGGGGGRRWVGATAWMARWIMRWYQPAGGVYYSGRFWFQVGRLNKRDRGGRGGGEHFNIYVRRNYKPSNSKKGDECDGCSKKTPLYITRAW